MLNKRPNKEKKPFWRINEQIRCNEVRVIASDGKQLDVMKPADALKIAQEEGLDLIEIAAKAKPPVVKIANFGKFRYQEEKKRKKVKKKAKAADIKELRFSPFIGEADYNTRLKRINGFLKDGSKVRAVVKFKGRQMDSKPFGYNLMKKLLEDVETNVVVDMKPKFIGRHLVMVISPTNKGKTEKVDGIVELVSTDQESIYEKSQTEN